MTYAQTLEAFISSSEFNKALENSTQAGFSGSGYSVELSDDGTWRVLWDNQIGNLYQTNGIILSIPQFDDEDWSDFQDSETEPNDYNGELAQQLRDSLDEYEVMVAANS